MDIFELGDVLTYQQMNDIIKLFASTQEPEKKYEGQIWLDISGSPPLLKRLNGSLEWEIVSETTANEILDKLKTVDGSGSGLDTDKVDGLDSSSFLRSDTDDIETGRISFRGGISDWGVTYGGNLEVRSPDDSSPAIASFHMPGNFAAYIGLDTDHRWKVGGWSMGLGSTFEIWHAGNHGSGSGLDADKIDGLEIETGVAAGSMSGQWNAFSQAFISTPDVTVTPTSIGTGAPYLSSITTTGFTLVTPAQNGYCRFHAIGPR